MVTAKYELMKDLEMEIKDNLFDMDSLIDLMSMEEYEGDKDLEEAFNNLLHQTEELKRQYYEVCEELDAVDELVQFLGA